MLPTTTTGRELIALRLTSEAAFLSRLRAALKSTNGDRLKTSKLLGVSERTLYRWIVRYNLQNGSERC